MIQIHAVKTFQYIWIKAMLSLNSRTVLVTSFWKCKQIYPYCSFNNLYLWKMAWQLIQHLYYRICYAVWLKKEVQLICIQYLPISSSNYPTVGNPYTAYKTKRSVMEARAVDTRWVTPKPCIRHNAAYGGTCSSNGQYFQTCYHLFCKPVCQWYA